MLRDQAVPGFSDPFVYRVAAVGDRGHLVTARPRPECTSGGILLTDKYIEQLAAEAEAGYDVDQLISRPMDGARRGRAAAAAK